MDKFGVESIRDLVSFGVSGVLGRKAQVLYSPLFDTRHLGRVCDLIVAQLRPSGLDEFQIRNLLSLSILYACSGQTQAAPGELTSLPVSGETLINPPIYLECGIDLEKIVISVNFELNSKIEPRLEGIAERVMVQNPIDEFEKALIHIHNFANRMILRYVPETRMVEIVTLIGLTGRIEAEVLKKRVPLELVLLQRALVNRKAASQTEEFLNLGDLDHEKLLERDHKKEKLKPVYEEMTLLEKATQKISAFFGGSHSTELEETDDEDGMPEKILSAESVDAAITEGKKLLIQNRQLEKQLVETSKQLNQEVSTNKRLKEKLELLDLQAKVNSSLSTQAADYSVLKIQFSKLNQQMEEMKTRNQMLVTQLNQLKKS